MDIPRKTNGECLNDNLEIISGNIIVTLCGNLSEYSSKQLFYQSSLSEVDIVFTSDYLHEGRGFWIEYSSHVPCSNKTFVNTSGNVFSDNYPNKYSNNQDCFYIIELSETNGLLELVFESFYTETVNDAFLRGDLCNLDYLEIYIDDKVERICGQWKGQEHTLSFRTETKIIMLRFVTNDRVARAGFFATWQNILQNVTVPQCSSTWIEREEYSFEIVRNPLTWEEGRNDCQHKGGYLAAITDMDTQLMLETYLIQRYFHFYGTFINSDCAVMNEKGGHVFFLYISSACKAIYLCQGSDFDRVLFWGYVALSSVVICSVFVKFLLPVGVLRPLLFIKIFSNKTTGQ